MKVIVPLAGGDLVHPAFGLKPLYRVEGMPLLALALERRPWFVAGEVDDGDVVFVLREGEALQELRGFLLGRYPRAQLVTLSHATEGALFSATAGAACVGQESQPLCIDLADILYDWPDYRADMLSQPGRGAVVPVFPSDDPGYSYLRIEDGSVVEAAEKRVISPHASAGTYLFANSATFLAAASHSIVHAERLGYRSALFVCPAINGVIAAGLSVSAPGVGQVRPISRLFHIDQEHQA